MKTFLLVSVLFLPVFKFPVNKTLINNYYLLKSTDSTRYAILKHTKDDFIFSSDAAPATLSSAEVQNILDLVYKKVDEYNKAVRKKPYAHLIRRPKRYYKQIIAVTNSKGEKEVWVNCFCNSDDKSRNDDNSYWKKGIVSVYDGGSCYFNLRINLTTNRVYDFSVNGVA